jgi:hypothetical protein
VSSSSSSLSPGSAVPEPASATRGDVPEVLIAEKVGKQKLYQQYHYSMEIRFVSHAHEVPGRVSDSCTLKNPPDAADSSVLDSTMTPTGVLWVTELSDVGSGHPIVDPTGRYVITDAYAKEARLLARSMKTARNCSSVGDKCAQVQNQRNNYLTALQGTEVPLRLIDSFTKEEVWIAQVNLITLLVVVFIVCFTG